MRNLKRSSVIMYRPHLCWQTSYFVMQCSVVVIRLYLVLPVPTCYKYQETNTSTSNISPVRWDTQKTTVVIYFIVNGLLQVHGIYGFVGNCTLGWCKICTLFWLNFDVINSLRVSFTFVYLYTLCFIFMSYFEIKSPAK